MYLGSVSTVFIIRIVLYSVILLSGVSGLRRRVPISSETGTPIPVEDQYRHTRLTITQPNHIESIEDEYNKLMTSINLFEFVECLVEYPRS